MSGAARRRTPRLAALLLCLLLLPLGEAAEAAGAADGSHFRLLLIGNSYSEDAANCGQGMTTSRLYDMLQNAFPGKSVTVGLLYSPGKSMAWCYDKDRRGLASHTLRVIGGGRTSWEEQSGRFSVSDGLRWADWDAVVLQPYEAEQTSGVGGPYFEEVNDHYSYSLEETLGYFLHLTGTLAPNAKRYLYMAWSTRVDTSALNGGAEDFALRVRYMLDTEYVGKLREEMGAGAYTVTGERFDAVIPCGTAIQNARNSYLALLRHNPGTNPLELANDPVDGLLRDGYHVSFNQGRFLLALTFARVLTGADAGTLCSGVPLHYGAAFGPLPRDYLDLVLQSVEAALLDPMHVTDFGPEDDTDPALRGKETLEAEELSLTLPCTADRSAVLLPILNTRLKPVAERWPELTVEEVRLLPDAGEERFAAEVTLRFGYTAVTAVAEGPLRLSHQWGEWRLTKEPTADEDGEEERRCARCGGRETRPLPRPDPLDLNGSGCPDPEDARILFLAVSRRETAAMPDLNGDGLVNNRDAILLFRQAARPA